VHICAVNDYFIINLSFATRWAIQAQASDAGSGERYRLSRAMQAQVGDTASGGPLIGCY